tara:strand:+ start:637 stop:930 length:294 start_codon:yes stop_codon:yes gene_type:complete
MNISFKDLDDGLSCEICLNGIYLGTVCLNVWSQKWSLKPSFKIPYSDDGLKKEYDSSYIAGKELVELYNFFFPEISQSEQEFGINLSDMLTFLKERK